MGLLEYEFLDDVRRMNKRQVSQQLNSLTQTHIH